MVQTFFLGDFAPWRLNKIRLLSQINPMEEKAGVSGLPDQHRFG
jgi:hypothetical protein